MKRTITLLDGVHELTPPTFYALQLMSEYEVVLGDDLAPSTITGVLAALLTDSEPLDDYGVPVKVWTPVMVAKQLDPRPESIEPVVEVAAALLAEAFPPEDDRPKDDTPARPTTKARTGSKSA